MNRQDIPSNNGTATSATLLTPSPKEAIVPKSWYPANNNSNVFGTPSISNVFGTPSTFETKQDLYSSEEIFGEVTQTMALEDDILDIEAVSTGGKRRSIYVQTKLTCTRLIVEPRKVGDLEKLRQGKYTMPVNVFYLLQFYHLTTSAKQCQTINQCMLQVTEQHTSNGAQENKCLAKEKGRQQVLANMMPLPNANTDWANVASLEKSKQSAVTIRMKQVQRQSTTMVANNRKKTVVVKAKSTKKKAPPKLLKVTPDAKVKDGTKKTRHATGTVIQLCGCPHGDLSVIQSLTKANAAYYTRPNKFLEGKSCLDCKLPVTEMKTNATSQRAVAFYCNQGIKGFGAPDDDPMKDELTCDLVLCADCEAKRRITFDRMGSGHSSSSRKRSRQ